jgi:hypothetical protein
MAPRSWEWGTLGVVDPGSGEPWEWGTLGVADPGNGGPWEWRTLGVQHPNHHFYVVEVQLGRPTVW